ncbi:MAG: anti-sigma factor, partial [Planctomycetes bacterium]|nr:anti-sigma factor [Planctomycetota bacterium]
DLAIEAFTQGVDDLALANLQDMAGRHELEDFEQVVAAIHWSHAARMITPPSHVMERLEKQAAQWLEKSAPDPVEPEAAPARPTPWLAIAGWALAASLLFFLFAKDPKASVPTPQQAMRSLIAQAPDLQRIDWSATEDPLAAQASGEVVWSDALQEGYMVFRGLEPNDPQSAQFQLWIFDPNRVDWDKTPVDGGVFDVTAAGEVIVPIHAKLPVRDVALFAVTLEAPGGVVVSKREHLLLTAASS